MKCITKTYIEYTLVVIGVLCVALNLFINWWFTRRSRRTQKLLQEFRAYLIRQAIDDAFVKCTKDIPTIHEFFENGVDKK